MKRISFDELFANSSNTNDEVTKGFFTDTYPDGYETKENFQQYLFDQRVKPGRSHWRIIHIKNFFENAKLGRRMIKMPEEVWDDGEKWMWCRFTFGKITQSLKIADGGGMHDFIRDYALGKIKVTYDLKDLLDEALIQK
ncbi:hypothetical protein [Pedobacter panaciterrae]